MKAFLTCFMVFTSYSVFAQEVKEVKPTNGLCSKATGISKGFGEYVGSRMKVSVSSVNLIRASDDTLYGGCSITIDTAKGPQSCGGATLYTNGKDYWIGGICF